MKGLRKFDVENAKHGDDVLFCDRHTSFSKTAKFLCRCSIDTRLFVIEFDSGISINAASELFHVPIGEVEGKAVYPGDELYYNEHSGNKGARFVARRKHNDSKYIYGAAYFKEETYDHDLAFDLVECLTWNKPKQKKTGWIAVNVKYHPSDKTRYCSDVYFDLDNLKRELRIAPDGKYTISEVSWEE